MVSVPYNAATNAICELLQHALIIPPRLAKEPGSIKIGVHAEEVDGLVCTLIPWQVRLPAKLRPVSGVAPYVFEIKYVAPLSRERIALPTELLTADEHAIL